MHDDPTTFTPLHDLSPDAEGHFQLAFFVVLARILAHLHTVTARQDGSSDAANVSFTTSFPFLADYDAVLESYQPGPMPSHQRIAWWEMLADQWQASISAPLPLRTLARALGLNSLGLNLLVLVGLVEEDMRFGAAFAALQHPFHARRPCLGLLGWLLSDPGAPGVGTTSLDLWPLAQEMLAAGLLVVENVGEPRAEWVLRVPAPVWDALRGRLVADPAPGLHWLPPGHFPDLDALILPGMLYDQAQHLPDLLADGQIETLVLRGTTGSGRRTLIGAVAQRLDRGLLLCDQDHLNADTLRLLGPLALLSHSIPVLQCDPGPGETVALERLPGYRGPVGVVLGRSGGLRGDLTTRALSITLLLPAYQARRLFWESTGVPIDPDHLDHITNHFLLSGGLIHRAARLGQTYAALAGRPAVITGDVQLAMRALNRQTLDTLATHLEAVGGWDDVVVSDVVMDDLLALGVRCRERERLREHAGTAFRHTLNRGVRAMFSGPSGTGKTLAARVLAAVLHMDLYRVDLAAVVNKYIGETERNLNQVFSRAEELDVILLLDEGDALLTKRTEVRNSNDRYANLETNYLLQRLENYEGIVIITTNASQRIDNAFLRRLDVVVDFAPPGVAERALLWAYHLPSEHAISPALLEEIAARCVLTGGQIRNAALHTTLLALHAGEAPHDRHLEEAVQREYRKAGAAYPLRTRDQESGQAGQVRRFSELLNG